jgi:hypothetical protein
MIQVRYQGRQRIYDRDMAEATGYIRREGSAILLNPFGMPWPADDEEFWGPWQDVFAPVHVRDWQGTPGRPDLRKLRRH